MQIPLGLDRSRRQPLAEQLADQLRDAIRQGRIPAGARLPSSRSLAEQLGLGRNTVVRVYETLTMEGLVESRAASGVFACRRSPDDPLRPPLAPSEAGNALAARASLPLPRTLSAPRQGELGRNRVTYDFVPGRPHVELFPVKSWRRLVQGCLSYRGAAGLTERADAAGLFELRSAIAAQVAVSRGVVADPEQILIINGIQEGLSLCAGLFLSPQATVVLEDPCYEGARLAFQSSGARISSVGLDQDGLSTAELPNEPASLLYLTPAHQYPTGHSLAPARRAELIAWARSHGCYIVEDDYDSHIHYEGDRLQALAALAPDCTILLGTFSTSLGAGLRLGYLVAPPSLVDAFRAEKALRSGGSSWLEQAVLAEFLQSGGYAAHVTRSRAQYRESRDALIGALRRHFGKVEISGEAAGMHVFWQLPAGVPEAVRLEALARRHRVGIYSLATAGAIECEPSVLSRRSLVLGYASLLPKQIEEGIARLSDAIDDTLDDHHDFIRELLLDGPPCPNRPAALRKPNRPSTLLRPAPALRTVARRRPRNKRAGEDPTLMRSVRAIYRYPIKGLSPQPVHGVDLDAGKPFPFDRVFALVRPNVPIDAEAPRWAKKGLFLMLMLDDALARVQTHLDVETLKLSIVERESASAAAELAIRARADAGRRTLLEVDLGTRAGREAVEAFFRQQVPGLAGAPRLVRAVDGHFMDKPDSVISCINLATVRSLAAHWGRPVHPLRFRANFYLDGLRPWEEFDWLGSDILLGDVLFRVDRRNGRCGATNVNPETGERDMDIPGSLRKAFGHKDLGIYLIARNAGKVVVGDPVTVPDLGSPAHEEPLASTPPPGQTSFICRGCYYIYDETKGALGAGTKPPFAALGEDFRCPDCGTEKANFRPYLAASPDLPIATFTGHPKSSRGSR